MCSAVVSNARDSSPFVSRAEKSMDICCLRERNVLSNLLIYASAVADNNSSETLLPKKFCKRKVISYNAQDLFKFSVLRNLP
jgi:hypothetical protein